MRLNCFIEQELAENGFTDVAIYRYFFCYKYLIKTQRSWFAHEAGEPASLGFDV